MPETVIRDLPWARFLAGNNELKLRAKTAAETNDQRAADACVFRFQVPVENLQGSNWLGGAFADVVVNDVERVQMKLGFKLDPGPVLELYATRPGSAGNDADEVRVFRIGLGGAEFGVPLQGVITAGDGGRISRFWGDSGRYVYNVQDDEMKITVYEVDETKPEGQWKAVGELRIPRLS